MTFNNRRVHIDGKSKNMSKDFKSFATENKGIFRIGAVDCDDQSNICSKEKVTTFPTFRVYPPFPIPTFDVDYSSKFDSKSIRAKAG